MVAVQHLTTEQLESGLDEIRNAPKDAGTVHLIVRRPETLGREVLEEGQLDTSKGLVGDNWRARGSGQTEDGSADPECQITIMNSRVTDLVAQDKDRWHLAGDQFYVEMDISRRTCRPERDFRSAMRWLKYRRSRTPAAASLSSALAPTQ